jgi:hypothetical protein
MLRASIDADREGLRDGMGEVKGGDGDVRRRIQPSIRCHIRAIQFSIGTSLEARYHKYGGAKIPISSTVFVGTSWLRRLLQDKQTASPKVNGKHDHAS